ncbi:MAG: hypothetical protein JW798_02300, partial [Prolixibacteraceae bacterium]|nr:hypothetical protein [Prolixibacteraceae bacterium]
MRKSIHLNIIILPSVFLLIVLNCFSAGQERYLHFTEIDGLPRNITTCLEQDQYGYIWIGTNNGIARYDGKDFYGYKELTGIGIIHLLYDSGNSLWASTSKGLYKYNRITNFFELIVQGYIPKIEEDNGSIYFLMNSNIFRVSGHDTTIFFPGSDISDFCFSEEGLWVSKSNDGVSLFGRKNKFNEPRVSFLKNKSVSLIRMIDNKLFVGLFNGELYSIADSSITQVNIKNHYYFEKFEKVGNEIWLATDGNGIIILDENLCFSRKLGKNENEGASINSNSIYDILPGKNEEIWLASFGAGLTCILPDNLLFQNILPEKGNLNSLVANEGVSVLVKEPFVYFGTNYGLSEWNINSGQFVNISSEKLIKDLNGTKVTATNVDRANNIWIGTYDGLMGKYSPGFKLSDIYHPCSTEKGEMQQIIDIIEVGKDNLLVLTQFRSRILLNFNTRNKTSGLFELYTKGSNITYCLLNSLRRNKQGELLAVITDQGLFHVNWNTNVLENRLSEMNSKIDFTITDFYQDENENYWITSSADGLLYITQDGKILKKWSVKDGLPSNTLVRVESTDNRFLWISTISGICRFDTETEEVMNFNHRDGLPANEFQERVSATISDGRIIFGSLAGFTIIDPSKLNPDTSKTEVVISDISFQNQSIRNPDGRQYLTKPLEETKEIKLPYSKNSFSIHYFTKNKSFSKYHNYEYRLVGFDENWVYQGETNYTTYTNLSPGTYAFEIRSADKSQPGITTRLAINIQPPWYLGWYAFLIYILLFFLILYLSIYAFLKRFELFKEKEIAEIKIQQEHELTEKKLAFFTNISHDLKTPLTLIDAPVNDLLQSGNLNRDQLEKLKIVNRNSKRLYKLITDLLDFRKIAQKQYLTEIGLCNISDILADTCEAFKGECKNKSIGLKCNSGNNIVGYVDAKIIEKILWNLLSNSLKFTKKGGTISVCAEELLIEGNKNVKLEVSDNGIGISENDKGKIFDRFFKVQGSGALNKGG